MAGLDRHQIYTRWHEQRNFNALNEQEISVEYLLCKHERQDIIKRFTVALRSHCRDTPVGHSS